MTATQEPAAQEIGRDRRRKEDQRLITGRTRWTDNITLPGMLHLAMVRSPFPHARIIGIDTAAAKQSPNVVAVLTGADLGEGQGACINAWPVVTDPARIDTVPLRSKRTSAPSRPGEPAFSMVLEMPIPRSFPRVRDSARRRSKPGPRAGPAASSATSCSWDQSSSIHSILSPCPGGRRSGNRPRRWPAGAASFCVA